MELSSLDTLITASLTRLQLCHAKSSQWFPFCSIKHLVCCIYPTIGKCVPWFQYYMNLKGLWNLKCFDFKYWLYVTNGCFTVYENICILQSVENNWAVSFFIKFSTKWHMLVWEIVVCPDTPNITPSEKSYWISCQPWPMQDKTNSSESSSQIATSCPQQRAWKPTGGLFTSQTFSCHPALPQHGYLLGCDGLPPPKFQINVYYSKLMGHDCVSKIKIELL